MKENPRIVFQGRVRYLVHSILVKLIGSDVRQAEILAPPK